MHVGKQTNFVKELFNDKSTEGVARYENMQELLNSIKEWVDSGNRSIPFVDEEDERDLVDEMDDGISVGLFSKEY